MMHGSENPSQVFLIDGDISKTLTNCATDPNPGTRQEYGKILLLILRQQPLEEILKHIHDIASTLLMVSEDEVSAVRIHLVDRIVSITLQVREHASPDLEYYLHERLLQILLKYFQDNDYVVRTEASTAFNLLLDKGAIDKKTLIEKACPAILTYTKYYENENKESRTATAVALMGRIAPIIGGEALEELFLDNYIDMCLLAPMSVRHPCSNIFPVMCQVLGTKITEERLLDVFTDMANSESWSLRKICAENLALVASVCTPECRRDRLTRIVLKLAKDPKIDVVNATFKVLGQFIATFSTPKVTGLAYTQDGELYITNPSDTDFSKHSDPKLVESYNDYINHFDDTAIPAQSNVSSSLSKSQSALKTTSPASSVSSSSDSSFSSSSKGSNPNNIKCNNSDSLSCEQIAKIIRENIVNINNQINVNAFMKKRKSEECYRTKLYGEMDGKREEVGDSNWLQLVDNRMNAALLFGEMQTVADDLFASHSLDTENNSTNINASDAPKTEGDSLNNFTDHFDMNNMSRENELVASSALSDEALALSSDQQADLDCNNKNLDEDNLLNNVAKPKKKSRKQMSTLFCLKKEAPTDLSSIIKNAIVEAKKLHPAPLHEKRKLILPPPPTASVIDLPTPTSEDKPLAWDDFLSTVQSKCKSTDRLNECQVFDQANNLAATKNGVFDDDDAFNDFNSHKFWYITPDVVLDNDLVNEPAPSDAYDMISTRAHFDPPTDYNQNVVPVEILETYVKMVLNEEDEEVNLICAYDFPAVAFTIGKSNWHILKKLLQYLCDELDWKVRKTVASYIDLLAVILGKELATQDLVQIFIGFFKDLDQVKIKAIANFAKFLKCIDFSKHEEILSNIGVCLRIDSKTNWRIKEDLAQQILIIIKWYDSINRHDYLLYMVSVTGIFLEDKISCVREIGAEAMAEIIRICTSKQREAIIKHYLVKEFSQSPSWRKRQTFVNIFYRYIIANRTNPENVTEYVQLAMADIRRLSYDSVPNIRLLVAKCLVQLINDSSILTGGDCEDVDILKIMRRLQEDDDRDVWETAHLVDMQSGKPEESTVSAFFSAASVATTTTTTTTSIVENETNVTNNVLEDEPATVNNTPTSEVEEIPMTSLRLLP